MHSILCYQDEVVIDTGKKEERCRGKLGEALLPSLVEHGVACRGEEATPASPQPRFPRLLIKGRAGALQGYTHRSVTLPFRVPNAEQVVLLAIFVSEIFV